VPGDVGGGDVLGHGGVEQPRTVHVQPQPVGAGHRLNGRKVLRRQRVAVLAAVAVLHQHQAAGGQVGVVLAHGIRHRIGIQPADGVRRQRVGDHATQRGHAARLPGIDVAIRAQDGFVAAAGVGQHGAEVAHRAAGDEQARFFAHFGRGQRLQLVDSGIFAIHVVTHRRGGHGRTHRQRRPTDGIGAEVDAIHRR